MTTTALQDAAAAFRAAIVASEQADSRVNSTRVEFHAAQREAEAAMDAVHKAELHLYRIAGDAPVAG